MQDARMQYLVDHDVDSLEAALRGEGLNPCHARTILRQFYDRAGRFDPDALSIGKGARALIECNMPPRRSRIAARTVARDGTVKLLVEMAEGGAVESVMMPGFRAGVAAGCVSSQIGCAMGCDFCASTRHGLSRSLEAGEIVEQFLHLREEAAVTGRRLRTLVFMGMGEPLLNYDAVVGAIRRITSPAMGSLGARQVAVSTVGIVPAIDRLAEENLNVALALSLHAPDDATRQRLVPMNRRYRVADVMDAARRFLARTGRIPNIEYCMLAGVNDSDAQAVMLADLMEGLRAHVNLIPYNSIGAGISGIHYAQPTRERMDAFIGILRDRGVVAHFREPRGDDVNAACGQLRESALIQMKL